MKISKFILSSMVVSAAMIGFTSCDDDDTLTVLDPVEVVTPEGGESTIVVPAEPVKVKIGEDVALPVQGGEGAVSAFSLDESVAKIVDNNGTPMIQGLKNGVAEIMVTDAANTFKKFTVSVYTTDVMQLNKTTLDFSVTLGTSASNDECKVELGNGGYSATTDNARVSATVDEEGNITISARGGLENYTAIVTVHDVSGLSADITVNVITSLEPFTAEDIEDIKALTSDDVWADCKDPSDGNRPAYYSWYKSNRPVHNAVNGTMQIGWWYGGAFNPDQKNGYGGLIITYPEGAAVNAEVAGNIYYQYSYSAWYDMYVYEGKAKVIEDNETRTIAIAWQIDTENERINRAYVVSYK